MEGKIIKQISNDYTILSDKLYICKARGKFRNLGLTPLVGDEVIFDEKDNYILDILPRKNELIRPSIANIDMLFKKKTSTFKKKKKEGGSSGK